MGAGETTTQRKLATLRRRRWRLRRRRRDSFAPAEMPAGRAVSALWRPRVPPRPAAAEPPRTVAFAASQAAAFTFSGD